MTSRNDLLDAARGVLILLVVWGHFLEIDGFGGDLYFAIYTFHIPAFVMISGMFATQTISRDGFKKLVWRLFVPLVCFQLLYFLTLDHYAPKRVTEIYHPAWIMWFLYSLLPWKLLLPLVVRLPFPVILSVGVALLAGYSDKIGGGMSLSRTIVFFPAFLIGHLYGARVLQIANRYRGLLACVFVVTFAVAFIWVAPDVQIRWLWGADPYSELEAVAPGFVYRAIAIGVGIGMAVALFAIVPRRSSGLAYLGRRTLPIYLMHGFAIIALWPLKPVVVEDVEFYALTFVLTLALSFAIALARDVLFRAQR